MDSQAVQSEETAEAQTGTRRTQGELDQPTIDNGCKIVALSKKTRYYNNNEDNKPPTKC